jgi:hypothetical protein
MEKIARGEQVGEDARAQIRAVVQPEQQRSGLVVLGAWALAKLEDRASLPLVEKTYKQWPRDRDSPELFEMGEEAAFLRLASLRLQKHSGAQTELLWAKVLLSDENPLVRAEAARLLVAMRHPRAHDLLLEAYRAERRRGASSGPVLIQVAAGLVSFPSQESDEAVWWLRWNGQGVVGPPYSWVLELEDCKTLFRPPCRGWQYYSVKESGRRALERLRPPR